MTVLSEKTHAQHSRVCATPGQNEANEVIELIVAAMAIAMLVQYKHTSEQMSTH